MSYKTLKFSSASLYVLGLAATSALFLSGFVGLNINHIVRFFAAVFVLAVTYFAGVLGCAADFKDKHRQMHKCVCWLFVLYILMIIDSTLINGDFGRNISVIFSLSKEQRLDYVALNTNFVPFKTVTLFIKGFKEGNVGFFAAAENILGNFLVFMPMPFFLSLCFKSINNFAKSILITSAAVVTVELLQLLLLAGSADIDDFILNVSGAALFYALMKTKFAKKAVNILTLGEF